MTWVKFSSGNPGNTNPIIDQLTDLNGKLAYKGSAVDTVFSGTIPSKWSGKILNVIGDSITLISTINNGAGTFGYHDYIKQTLGLASVINNGGDGTGYFTPYPSGQSNAIYQRISGMSTNCDLITVFAGTNDWASTGKTFVLGAFGDTNGATSFYGALDSTFSQLVAKYPLKTIAAFTPIPRNEADTTYGTNTTGNTLDQVADAIIKVANKYSIPVLDLRRNSNVNATNATYRTNFLPDGLHPNNAGMQRLSDKMVAFLNTL